jgi:hypothetical protein
MLRIRKSTIQEGAGNPHEPKMCGPRRASFNPHSMIFHHQFPQTVSSDFSEIFSDDFLHIQITQGDSQGPSWKHPSQIAPFNPLSPNWQKSLSYYFPLISCPARALIADLAAPNTPEKARPQR